MNMIKTNKMVFGVGINDADYFVQQIKNGKQVKCPYYQSWNSMLRRCYSVYYQTKYPAYRGCSVCEDWKSFSKFKVWMETQDWEGKQLDKDLLVKGNKIYSPDTCVFLTQRVNKFLTERNASRGQYPIGVCYRKKAANRANEPLNPYLAQINDGTGRVRHIGVFRTPEQAHKAWLLAKIKIAKELASLEADQRISKALLERYQNYEEVI